MQEIDDLKLLLKASKDDDDDEKDDDDATPNLDIDINAGGEGDEDDEDEKKEMRGGKGKGKGDDDSGEYDVKYIKKYLKKYAKENDDDFKKFCKDMGVLKKAVTDLADSEGVDEADAVLIDGTSMFKAFNDLAEGLVEAVAALKGEVNEIKDVLIENTVLSKASSSVLVKAAETLDSMGSIPEPSRGVRVAAMPAERANPLMKGDFTTIKRALLKAAENGDTRAFSAMTKVESCYGNLAMVGEDTLKYIQTIIQ